LSRHKKKKGRKFLSGFIKYTVDPATKGRRGEGGKRDKGIEGQTDRHTQRNRERERERNIYSLLQANY
jgi:hypothetical protein